MNDEIRGLKEKIDAANALAWGLRNSDVEQARTLLEEARELSTTGEFKESPYHEGLIRSLTGLGYIHRITGDLNKAMIYLTEAQQLSEATGLLQSMVFVTLGSVDSLLGDLLQSLQAYEKGLAAAKSFAINNQNFLREDAYLAVVYVSDEEDQSRGTVSSIINEIRSFTI